MIENAKNKKLSKKEIKRRAEVAEKRKAHKEMLDKRYKAF